MKSTNRRLWIVGVLVLVAIAAITILAAPSNNKLNSGSTFSLAPDGYGAWYAFMAERGTPVQRWQKPFADLAAVSLEQDSGDSPTQTPIASPITFLRIYPDFLLAGLRQEEREWVKAGNNFIILGARQPVTPAPFSSILSSQSGSIKIETGRRRVFSQEKQLKSDRFSNVALSQPLEEEGREVLLAEEELLGDRFGAVVWSQSVGEGEIVFVVTPYLAANAYQDEQGNYEFLAELVTRRDSAVFADEYFHGYKDSETISEEYGQSWLEYLAGTPLAIALLQGAVVLSLAFWAQNRRFGPPISLPVPVKNNSEAYIRAAAAVLAKAESTEFVLEMVGKEEKRVLQRALGLGSMPLDSETIVAAWVRQTGNSPIELQELLSAIAEQRRIREKDLITWLGKVENARIGKQGN